MKDEVERLETGIRRFTRDDLFSRKLFDTNNLEQQLDKVRTRKVLLTIVPLIDFALILAAVQMLRQSA